MRPLVECVVPLFLELLEVEPPPQRVLEVDERGHAWVRASGTTDECGWCGCTRHWRAAGSQPARDGAATYTRYFRGRWTDGVTAGPPPCIRARPAKPWARRIVEAAG